MTQNNVSITMPPSAPGEVKKVWLPEYHIPITDRGFALLKFWLYSHYFAGKFPIARQVVSKCHSDDFYESIGTLNEIASVLHIKIEGMTRPPDFLDNQHVLQAAMNAEYPNGSCPYPVESFSANSDYRTQVAQGACPHWCLAWNQS
jgi:hypothetical protein